MNKISSENVLEIQTIIDKLQPSNVFSAFTYLSWSSYGIELSYEYNQEFNCILISSESNLKYLDYTSAIYHYEMVEDINRCHLIIAPITHDSQTFTNAINYQINKIMQLCKSSSGIYVDDLTNEQTELLCKDYVVEKIFKVRSNYIYTQEQLSTMAGRKMQKKRNHLNFYLKNYEYESEIKKIDQIPFDVIIDYLQNWTQDNDKFNISSEIDFVNNCKRFIANGILKGTALYYKNKLIGITISFEHGDYCEILVEHANKRIRGSYQYLLSRNIMLNHPTVKYIDRQDDVWSSEIDYSKRTYKPIEIIEKNFILIKGIKNNVN